MGKGKKGKKAKSDKLPKKIAGVKVPKELRNVGGVVARLARDPAAREVALAALTAALAARKDNRQAARKAIGEAGEAAQKAGKSASWIGPALTAAAVEAGRMLVDAYDGGNGSRDGSPPAATDEADAKPAKKLKAKDAPNPGVTH